MGTSDHPGATAGPTLVDVRRALGVAIDACREAAWSAMRRDGEGATVPLAWLVRHTEALCDLDRALVVLDRGAGVEHRAAG